MAPPIRVDMVCKMVIIAIGGKLGNSLLSGGTPRVDRLEDHHQLKRVL